MSQDKTIVEEKKILRSPEPVSIEGTQRILNQLMNCVFKININSSFGSGFFCEIPLTKNEAFNCLITNYHVLNEEYYKQKGKIDLIINDDNIINIDITNIKRRTYFNKDYDIAIIELKENDDITDFLELDEHLFNNGEDVYYKDKSIYILQYPNGGIAKVSYGILGGFNKYDVQHFASTLIGSSGSPILNLETNKVIAIHKGHKEESTTKFNFNLGTFLKIPLIDFKNKINEDHMKNKYIKDNKDNKDKNYMEIKIKKDKDSSKDDKIKNNKNNNNKDESNKINDNFIKDKNYENNGDSNSNKVLISQKSRIHVTFSSGIYDKPLVCNYETKVDEILNHYLKVTNRSELCGRNDKVTFKYDSKIIKFGEKTTIGEFLKENNINPKKDKILVTFN